MKEVLFISEKYCTAASRFSHGNNALFMSHCLTDLYADFVQSVHVMKFCNETGINFSFITNALPYAGVAFQ